jgi:peptidoglycan biosynthesis protein MviN/MurJ (putative lipid II flippase)
MNTLVEILGWMGSVLIVGSYALNITGRLAATHKLYVLANILGGIFFVVNTFFHQAYPSMFVNIVWVIIAIVMLNKKDKNKEANSKS